MVLLVTGVAGFIGSNFVEYYLSEHPEEILLGLDSLTYAGNLENLASLHSGQKDRFLFVKGDITDAGLVEGLFEENEIEGVIHFAAESHVDRSIEDPLLFLRTNILGTCTLLDAAKKTWNNNERFVQISTDEVYRVARPGGLVLRIDPPRPPQPVLREQGLGGPDGKGVPRHLRHERPDHPLLQQLRPVTSSPRSSSRLSSETRWPVSPFRSTGTGGRSGTGSMSKTTAGPSTWCTSEGLPAGCTTSGGTTSVRISGSSG